MTFQTVARLHDLCIEAQLIRALLHKSSDPTTLLLAKRLQDTADALHKRTAKELNSKS